jgi:hypothetical protein
VLPLAHGVEPPKIIKQSKVIDITIIFVNIKRQEGSNLAPPSYEVRQLPPVCVLAI